MERGTADRQDKSPDLRGGRVIVSAVATAIGILKAH